MREIVFDTETTGLSPLNGDRMVEIGCVELFNRVETGRTFHAYFNPRRAMPSEAEAVHGLSDIFLSDKPFFEESCEELLEFIGDSPLVAHNASFDFGFLNAELDLCGRPLIPMTRMVDTLVLARSRHPGAKHSLDALCTRYGVDRSLRIKHGALIDAQLLAQVYVELCGGRQIGFSLAAEMAEAGPSAPVATVIAAAARTVRPPRPHAASQEELARHAAFLAEITEPLWNRLKAVRLT
ncbi:DNA polymerase III subunit epsilon [Allosphingosinicella flava]|uniref:DNA polymerase III subunit epsilon n=1 Tax=Allosphingosinicella flava TaxID=2771430 RepID=A0A7T2GIM9_9SPHN|nr:DNA polymerase III subunit epsilon [Sphingosinicella flava]QPQ54544.1 DNA polymerase III subunit epsilon [Sphingosinicella flava]